MPFYSHFEGRISIVIPLYNEKDNVRPLVHDIHQHLRNYDYELILIDDGSTDGTMGQVPHEPHISLIQFEENAGQTAAMFAGMKAAQGDVIIFMDGDRQNDPADIPRLLAGIVAGGDLVCGSRSKRQDTFSRRVSSKIANGIRGCVLEDAVTDTGCTLKAMRRECRDMLIPFHGMHRFIPALLHGAGYRVSEIPVNHRLREAGVSKYGLWNRMFGATIDLIGVWWLQKRRLRYHVRGGGNTGKTLHSKAS